MPYLSNMHIYSILPIDPWGGVPKGGFPKGGVPREVWEKCAYG